MTSKTITYVLRTIRQLQSCNSLAGMSFPKCTRNYHLSVVTPLLSDTQTFRLAIVPSRCVSHDNSQHTEEKTFTSDGVDEPFDDSSAIPDVDHIGPLNEHFSSKTNELASSPTMSFTMIALSKCTTPREVLNVFSSPVYRKDELLEGVTKLWQTFLTRDQNQKLIERDLIVGHPNFCNLSHGIWKIASTLSPEALVRSLYVLVRLKVNQESKLIQDLLLLCQENLSSFNEVEITILANTLEWLNSDRNVNMLKFGLRLLMDLKIEEFNGVVPLLTMMKATGTTASLSLKLKFEKKALQMVDRFNVAQSENLFYILHDINFYSEHLLNACSRKLIDGIDELSYNNIVNLLSCCCKLVYSNESMFTVFGDHIMKTICLWKPQQHAFRRRDSKIIGTFLSIK
uniref:FAST kinase leucine-rich domain-containing protein n=1 Tax=Pyxicephalus adspersus TaxID=30357 RepID=A0AAV2ZNW6_PYXAD|nr:TPA: hypothetical protein GDO54_015780 [Pyxicephalus adspersus]